jgi:hypothetical protein
MQELLYNTADQLEQLKRFTRSLAIGERIIFSRFSDGELYMMLGKEIRLTPEGAWIDGKRVNSQKYAKHDCKTFAPNEDQDIVLELAKAFRHKAANYIVGMPYPCCVGEYMFGQLTEKYGLPNLRTTANLLINSNYPYFMQVTWKILQRMHLFMIVNEEADLSNVPGVVGSLRLTADCGRDYNNLRIALSEKLNDLRSAENLIILCAGSYLSNIFAHHVSCNHENISFVDIGTALHPVMGLGLIRDYLFRYWTNKEQFTDHTCSCI